MFDFIVLVMVLVFFGQMLIIGALLRHRKRTLESMAYYFEKKKYRAEQFAKNEKDEARKTTYEALECAWAKAQEVAEKEIEKW